jgi:hypothetical protein
VEIWGRFSGDLGGDSVEIRSGFGGDLRGDGLDFGKRYGDWDFVGVLSLF